MWDCKKKGRSKNTRSWWKKSRWEMTSKSVMQKRRSLILALTETFHTTFGLIWHQGLATINENASILLLDLLHLIYDIWSPRYRVIAARFSVISAILWWIAYIIIAVQGPNHLSRLKYYQVVFAEPQRKFRSRNKDIERETPPFICILFCMFRNHRLISQTWYLRLLLLIWI